MDIKVLKSEDIKLTEPKWTGRSKFANTKITYDGSPLEVSIKGTLFMPPRKQEDEIYGESVNMGIEFNEEDLKVLDETIVKMGEFVEEDFEAKEVHDNGKVFLKLPVGNNKARGKHIKCKSNIKLDINDLPHPDIEGQTPVTIILQVNGWFMKDELANKFGVSLVVKNIYFGATWTAPKKSNKRKIKVEEDDLTVLSQDDKTPSPKAKRTMTKADRKILNALNSK